MTIDILTLFPEYFTSVLDLPGISQSVDQYGSLLNQFTGSIETLVRFITSTFSVLFIFITLLVLTFHVLQTMDSLSLSFAWMVPGKSKKEKAEKSQRIFQEASRTLGAWVRGQLILMITIGVGTYIGLSLLGVPYALPLALLAGMLEIIPNLGPTLAAIPAIALAFLLGNPVTGFLTLIFYLLLQQVENNLIVPMIMREAVDVQPLTTIVLMLAGFEIWGVVGAVLVLPFYLIVRIISRELWPNKGPFAVFQSNSQDWSDEV